MRKTLLFAAVLALALPLSRTLAGETEKEVTVTGEVLDLTCYLGHGAKGEAHANCGNSCVAGGLPVGLLEDKTGNVYLVVTNDHKAANAQLAGKVGKSVKLTGVIKKGQGVNMFQASKIE